MTRKNVFLKCIFSISICNFSFTQTTHTNNLPSTNTSTPIGVTQEDLNEENHKGEYTKETSQKKSELKKQFDEMISENAAIQSDPKYKTFFDNLKSDVATYVDSVDMSYEKASALKGLSTYKHQSVTDIYESWTTNETHKFMHDKIMDFIKENPRSNVPTEYTQADTSTTRNLNLDQKRAAVETAINSATTGNPEFGFSKRDDSLNASSNSATQDGSYANAGQMASRYGMNVEGIDRRQIDTERYQNVYNNSYSKRPDAQRTQVDWNFGMTTPNLKNGRWTLYDVRGGELGEPIGIPDGRGGAYTGIMMTRDAHGLEKGWIIDSFGKVYDNNGDLAGVFARGNMYLAPREGRKEIISRKDAY